MNMHNRSTLTSEQIVVLQAVSKRDFIQSSTLSKNVGWPVREVLATVCALGYVAEVSSPRRDGTPIQLYAITALGMMELQKMQAQDVSEPVRTIGPRPPLTRETYNGAELQPFSGRSGSMDALKYPSRVGNNLRHRDDKSQ